MQRFIRSRRLEFVLIAGLVLFWAGISTAQIVPEGNLDPTIIPKYVEPLPIPRAMPQTAGNQKGKKGDYYEIAVRQIQQQILPLVDQLGNPTNLPSTTLWTYGSVNDPGTFQYPAFSIEAKVNKPVQVKWFNDLKDPVTGAFLPHMFPVDQTLHWANPPKDCIDGMASSDCRGQSQLPYTGPVPIVPHLHGAHVGPDSDGYPEAWWLPAASDIPAGYATQGTRFDQFDRTNTTPGSAVYRYPNDQRATTLWYHDHSLGMTRLNVYAGPVGFYLIRGGPSDLAAGLPGPAPAVGDPPGKKYYELPIAIQDKTFSVDGSRLVYPDNRAFFEGLLASQMAGSFFPYIPAPATGGASDVSPLWNPEFFANTMVVNGKTWPKMTVEPRRYRLRFLNGCDSRFLVLKLYSGAAPETLVDPLTGAGLPVTSTQLFWQIGSDGGFLPAPVSLDQLLIGPAERADVIVDFTALPTGTIVYLVNDGPDEPFGGGLAGVDFPVADRATTGQVMQFVVGPPGPPDNSIDPASGLLALPVRAPLPATTNTRQVSLNENESKTVFVPVDSAGNYILDVNGNLLPCDPATFTPPANDPGALCLAFGPTSAMLGPLAFVPDGAGGVMPMGMPMPWMDPITENPALNSTEVWEIYNFTMDAHPIHIHQVQFEVVDRQPFMDNATGAFLPNQPVRAPETWETGTKDTVIAYPGEITRVKARYDISGLFVWHCHILSHEDNEMMRPFMVGPRKELGSRRQLGRKLFFDMNLSSPAGQACASCHMPFAGFADPDSTLPVSQGVLTTAFGTRSAPSAAYAAFSPPFDPVTEVGGQFWDGRARTLKMQAMQPFLNPVEMNNTVAGVVAAVKADPSYVPLFDAVHPGLLATGTDQAIFDAVATDIAGYEKSGEVNQFTSKFDAFWRASKAAGIDPLTLTSLPNPAGVLTDMEFRGFLLFKSKGKCANCHTLTNLAPNPNLPPRQVEDLPVFTDFKYHNVGSPGVLSNPWYQFPAGFNPPLDIGLAGNPRYRPGTPAYDGALGRFKTPTLRNIAKNMPYGHNGYFYSPDAPTANPVFNSLMMIVHFYSTRDVAGQGWPMWPMNPVPGAPWPASEITANLNTVDMGNLMLMPDEGMAIVQFMMTLSDGFAPLP